MPAAEVDAIFVAGDDRVDRVRCGPGKDVVFVDRFDKVAPDCERVKPWPA